MSNLHEKALYRRLRRRAFRQCLHGELAPDACERLQFDDVVAGEVLRRLDAAKDMGDGTLWDFILSVDWLKLAAIIVQVLAMFGEAPADIDGETA